MNVSTVKRTRKRTLSPYLQAFNIKAFGEDNLYPQRLSDIVNASPTGRGCLARYARFIEGDGFKEGGDIEVSADGMTLDGILHAAAEDVAKYNGFALHVNYNVLGEVTDLQHIPFELCRLEEADDSGQVSHIIVHPDWQGLATRSGRRVTVTEENTQRFDVYNDRASVVRAQMESVGGIDYYRGQVLWVSGDGGMAYPLPKYDSAVSEMSTDEGISNVMARNVRNNFLAAGILYVRASQSSPTSQLGSYDFTEAIKMLQGDERALSLLQVTLEPGEEKPTLDSFPTKNFDKDFAATEQALVERIYCAFEQEPFLAIRNGKLGFSGTTIHDAYTYYSGVVSKEQRLICRSLGKVLKKWAWGVVPPLEVSQLRYSDNG